MAGGTGPAAVAAAGEGVVGQPAAAAPAQPRKAGLGVRLACDAADITAMMALGRVLHAESRYHTVPLDDARMREIGRRGLEGGNPGLLMAERDGELVGMAIVILGEYFFSPARTATVQLLYVRPEARGGAAAVKLLRALRRWAAANGAHDLHVNVTTGIEA
ncbi:MAG: GNAT family N-acetyltransferase, partial [Magnetospirillum sp.]|nr:GNAT family N-acetyltransferase [Magnetospirillum sp.]